MLKTRLAFVLALTLTLSACSPRQAAPAEVDTNLITDAPVNNYDGGDETVYFVALDPDGEEVRFEAGYIKNGKLTLTIDTPPSELQQPWIDTLPDDATDRNFGEGAESAMTVHVLAILIGDTGLMITGESSLTPASVVTASSIMMGLSWTSSSFQASWFQPELPRIPNGAYMNANYDHWVAYGQTGPDQGSTMDPRIFVFDVSSYEASRSNGRPGLPHPLIPYQPEVPLPEVPGDDE